MGGTKRQILGGPNFNQKNLQGARNSNQSIIGADNLRGIAKTSVSEQGWSKVFDLLFDKYLIDTPDDFYDENMPFNQADELNNIFSDLEKKNLDLIYEYQDTKSQLEELQKQLKLYKI